ncbi:MAG: hypothetical protein WDN46_05865 [Methylocella sp.]
MTAIIPIGFVTIDEAAEMIAKLLYMGVEDGELVATLWQSGLNVVAEGHWTPPSQRSGGRRTPDD